MALSRNKGSRDDVNNRVYNTRRFNIVAADGELEAFTDATTKESRQWVRVVNEGPGRIIVGPQGGDKQVLRRNQEKVFNHGDNLTIWVELSTGTNADVFVEESG